MYCTFLKFSISTNFQDKRHADHKNNIHCKKIAKAFSFTKRKHIPKTASKCKQLAA